MPVREAVLQGSLDGAPFPLPFYEDDAVLAVAKPSGIPVIPGRGACGRSLREILAERRPSILVVHRIDRDASGLVLFAKDPGAHRRLCMLFEKRGVRKEYLAVAQGRLDGTGRVDQPLREFGSGRVGVAASGRESLTRYAALEALERATLLSVEPLTGRRHQIRAHLFSIGHPVLGDPLYGKDRPVGGAPRLMLHSRSLELADAKGGRLKLACEPPEDFLRILEPLRRPRA